MSEDHKLVILYGNVHDYHVVSVNEDSLVADNQLLEPRLFVS